MRIEQILQNIGLNGNRTKTYLALLELKKASVLNLAEKTNILRTTLYDNIRFLKNKGLISEIIEGKKRLFIAESPKNLSNILKTKELELNIIMPELLQKFGLKRYEAKIKFYEGVEGVKKLHDEALNNKEKVLYGLGNMDLLRDYVSESYTSEFIKKRVRLKIKNKIVFSGDKEKYQKDKLFSPIENIRALRIFKVAPVGFEMAMFIMFFDEKVLFFAKHQENYSFIFESPSFNKTVRSIFNLLWQVSELIS